MRIIARSFGTRIPFERLLGWLATALVFVGMAAGGVALGGGARWVIGVPDLPGVLLLVGGVIVLALLGGLGHLLVRAVSPREAVVVRGTFSRQLVPFSDVAPVVRDRRGVRIARRGARDVLLRTPGAEWRPLRDTHPPPGAARPLRRPRGVECRRCVLRPLPECPSTRASQDALAAVASRPGCGGGSRCHAPGHAEISDIEAESYRLKDVKARAVVRSE
ncbi:hypothetical protein WMF30_37020 [Sorangium sp. So ce134]